MKYGPTINRYLAENKDLSNEEKRKEIAALNIDELFDLMHNVEEAPHKYDRPVIRAVVSALNRKNLFFL